MQLDRITGRIKLETPFQKFGDIIFVADEPIYCMLGFTVEQLDNGERSTSDTDRQSFALICSKEDEDKLPRGAEVTLKETNTLYTFKVLGTPQILFDNDIRVHLVYSKEEAIGA